jgi:hypothetical protein
VIGEKHSQNSEGNEDQAGDSTARAVVADD